jgi:hypothetical protein
MSERSERIISTSERGVVTRRALWAPLLRHETGWTLRCLSRSALRRVFGDTGRLERFACVGSVFGVPMPPLPPIEPPEPTIHEHEEQS